MTFASYLISLTREFPVDVFPDKSLRKKKHLSEWFTRMVIKYCLKHEDLTAGREKAT